MWRMTPSEGSMTGTCTNWTLSSRGEAVKPGASRVSPSSGAGRVDQAGQAEWSPASARCQGKRQGWHLCHANRHPPEVTRGFVTEG